MEVNDYFDNVVVINLDRRQDRMERLELQLKELGIRYERFSAVDALELDISPVVAGTQSHAQVLAKYQGQSVLVLEDDALFCDNFNEKFAEYIDNLPEDWDIFYLGALLPKHTGKVESIGNNYWFKQVFSTGSHAYSIKPELMQSFYDKLIDYEWYIDIGLREFATKALIAQPNLVTQFPSYSDLRLAEVDDF